MMRKDRLLAAGMAFALCAGLAGCGIEGQTNTSGIGQITPYESSPQSGDGELSEEQARLNRETLRVGYSRLTGNFQPILASHEGDFAAANLTQAFLLRGDDQGVSSANVRMDGAQAEIELTLREDIYFSDGEKLNADDVIFTMYALSDPKYNGTYEFRNLDIEGLDEYLEASQTKGMYIYEAGPGNEDFSLFTQQEMEHFWNVAIPEAGVKFTEGIIDYLYENFSSSYGAELTACGNNRIAFAMYLWGFGQPDDMGENITGLPSGSEAGSEYEIGLLTADDFWHEMEVSYGGDYALLSNMESTGRSLWDELYALYPEYAQGIVTADSAGSITGIEKTGEYSIKLTFSSLDSSEITQVLEKLCIPILPLHYYGTPELFDYENDEERFGFVKGDLSTLTQVSDKPMGAGPYRLEAFENGEVRFVKNDSFYLGEPQSDYIQLIGVANGDMPAATVEGTIDLFSAKLWPEDLTLLEGMNTNPGLSGDYLEIVIPDGQQVSDGESTQAYVYSAGSVDVSTIPSALREGKVNSWIYGVENIAKK